MKQSVDFNFAQGAMVRRFKVFLVVMLTLLIGLECLIRANEATFAALADKFLLREELIKQASDETEIMILGTSRLLDAVDQRVFAEAFEVRTGQQSKCFNTSIAGVNVEILHRFAQRVSEKEGVKMVLIEASTPSLTKQPVNLDGQIVEFTAKPGPNENRFTNRLEEGLRGWIHDRLALVRQRKALRPQTLVKFLVPATSDVIDPNLWDRKGVGRSIALALTRGISEVKDDFLIPTVVEGRGETFEGNEESEEAIASFMIRLTRLLQEAGKEVIWVAPPVGEQAVPNEHHSRRIATYEAVVNELETVLLNYTARGLGVEYLRDQTHLNFEGRNQFSVVLARDVSEVSQLREIRGDKE